MLDIQSKLNEKLGQDWKSKKHDFRLAIAVETVEFIDHLPWKWWKAYRGPVNLEQARMELVDIWHFLLSMLLSLEEDVLEKTLEALAEHISIYDDKSMFSVDNVMNIIPQAKEFLGNSLGVSETVLPVYLYHLCLGFGLTFKDLYLQYVGKSVLNQFRWNNGYGDTYIKQWFGQEDNQYLSEVLCAIQENVPQEGLEGFIYSVLQDQYDEVLKW
ncbi:MAG TPA: dUTP diphosphatase, partial [Methanosarcina sp.]|nr:dUTP diphosphatase [Methanosarcina sp.]